MGQSVRTKTNTWTSAANASDPNSRRVARLFIVSVYSNCTASGPKTSGVHMTYTKVVLTVIALLLATLAMRPVPVGAQTEAPNLYIEPGTSPIRNLKGGGITGEGKVVINLSTGEVWGFPTH